MADCSNSGLTQIPPSLPEDLDWLFLSGNNITFPAAKNIELLDNISQLDLLRNRIANISPEVLNILFQNSRHLYLNIAFNELRSLPQNIRNLSSLENLSISDNKFECTCDNIWMKDWILKKSSIIQNYKDIKCQMKSGKWIPIIQMKEVDLGCVSDGSFVVWKISGQI